MIGFIVLSIIGVGAGLGSMGGSEGAIAGGIIGFLFGMMVSMVLYIPVMMGLWFAPALVLFHQEIKPVEAMIMSFKACLKNFLPFIIYSVVVFVMFFIAMIPIGLGLLVAVPVIIASSYFGYRSIFTKI